MSFTCICNLAHVANFNVENICFNAIRVNKILAKISEFTVYDCYQNTPTNIGFRKLKFIQILSPWCF